MSTGHTSSECRSGVSCIHTAIPKHVIPYCSREISPEVELCCLKVHGTRKEAAEKAKQAKVTG